MALEQSLGSTMSLGAGTVNPGAAVENVLWPLILEGPKAQGPADETDENKGDDKSRQPVELFLHVCGGKQTGKSSIVNHILGLRNETSASTSDSELVRYQCRKYGDNKQEKLPPHLLPGDILNCWEYTSDEEAARAITGPNTMFIRNLSQMKRTAVLIVVDLSKPHEALPTLDFWLGRVRERCSAIVKAAEGTKNERVTQQLLGRAAKEFAQRSAKGDGSQGGSKHKDVKFVGFTGVGLVIVATNTDAFENEHRDPELRRCLVNCLRSAAHMNGAGASLFGLRAVRGNKSAEAPEVVELRAFVERLLALGPKAQMNNEMRLNWEPAGLLSVPAGEDSLAQIGLPKGAEGSDLLALESAWRELANRNFPRAASRAGRGEREAWEEEHRQYSVEAGVNMLIGRLEEARKVEKQSAERPPSTGRSRGGARPGSGGLSSSQQGLAAPAPPAPAGSAVAGPPRPRSSSKTTPRAPQ